MGNSPVMQFRRSAPLVLGALLFASCGPQLIGQGPLPTPTPLPKTSTQQARPTTQVRRGTIVEAIKVLGRVVAAQEADLFFKSQGRLKGIYVEAGDSIREGQVLAELETGDLPTRIGRARASFEKTQIQLQQTMAKAVLDDTIPERQTVYQAEINLDMAQLAVEKLRAGPLESDLRSAEERLIAAQVAMEKAGSDLATKRADLAQKRADLAAKLAGPTDLDLVNTRAVAETAKIKVAQARAGPKPEEIRAAQITLDQRRLDLAQLVDQPRAKPEDVANAHLAVEQAHVNLDKAAAEFGKKQDATTEAALKTAQLGLERAENDLSKLLNTGPTQWDVRQKELAVQAAEAALAKTTAPDPYLIQQAELGLQQAQAKLDALLAGPTDQELSALRTQMQTLEIAIDAGEKALPSTEAAVIAAQAKYEQTLRGPTALDLTEAENRVTLAEIALDSARAKLALKEQSLSQTRHLGGFDIESMTRSVEQERLNLAWLESQNIDSKLIAPFDGRVTKVAGKPGDSIPAYNIVISLANPSQLIVKADIAEADTPKLSVGQRVEMTMDAFSDRVVTGTIEALPQAVVTQTGVIADRATKIRAEWPGPGSEMGMLARVQIIVQRRDSVMIVPSSAVKTVGKRRFVEYMDGQIKRSRNVETGLSSDIEIEVVAGVDEGMTILAGQ